MAGTKYYTIKLTLDEVQLIGRALLKLPIDGPSLLPILGAYVESQQESPHPDAVRIMEGRI